MEDVKKFAKKFNACGNCGTSNDGFDVFRNNHPKCHDWCVQCMNCGRNMMAKTVDELLKNWNADAFKEPEKEDLDSSREYMEKCICGCSAKDADIKKIQDKYHCICPECGRHITADTRRQMVLCWNDRSYVIPLVMIKRHEIEMVQREAAQRKAAHAQRCHTKRGMEDEALRCRVQKILREKSIFGSISLNDMQILDKARLHGLM